MERDLADLRSRQVEAEAILPGLWPKVQIVEAGGCFLLDGFLRKPHLSPADFPDPTGLECNANKLRMEAMLDVEHGEYQPEWQPSRAKAPAKAAGGSIVEFGPFEIPRP